MTQTPQMLFRCDRCFTELPILLNDQPAQNRAKPPTGWLQLHVADVTAPAWHLCPGCREHFDGLMRECGGV
jgi:hypothetical protein